MPPLPDPEPDPEPEVPPPEPEVAPLGDTPPPVGPVAPLEPDPLLVPLEAVPPALDVAPDDPDVPEELIPEEDDPDEETPLDDEEVVVVVVEVLEVVDAGCCETTVAVGTVRGGAPAVSVAGEVPPHAARPTQIARAAPTRTTGPGRRTRAAARRRGTARASEVERLHAPSAVRAVVEVLLAELVAPVAEAKVLDRPGELRRSGRQREELGHDLERLTGVPIDIDASGLGLDHDLSPGGWRPHPVALTRPHPQPSYSSARRGVPVRPTADGLDRVPPVEVWLSRWDAFARSWPAP